jgi:hypothetical protein
VVLIIEYEVGHYLECGKSVCQNFFVTFSDFFLFIFLQTVAKSRHFVILSTCHSVNWSFCQLVILSTYIIALYKGKEIDKYIRLEVQEIEYKVVWP